MVSLPPCAHESPIRAAGLPPIITFVEPMTIESGGPTQVHMEPTVAAGIPPISTVGTPGGRIGPPTCGTGGVPGVTIGQTCRSPTRAAGGMARSCPRAARRSRRREQPAPAPGPPARALQGGLDDPERAVGPAC